ncbi:MAG: hypothetical protein PF795_02955 [Kiritimatiellae bacterium]|jgi:hypothetical protein|nr:hypothetical protein [Kiritimatiellia bacterium]
MNRKIIQLLVDQRRKMKSIFTVTILSMGILLAGCNSPGLPQQDLTLIRIQTDAVNLPGVEELNPVFVLRSSAPKGFILGLSGEVDLHIIQEALPESVKILMQEKVTVIK